MEISNFSKLLGDYLLTMKRAVVVPGKKETVGPLVVISQLPPPHHGSTVMTQVFLETLDSLGVDWHLVDRRFSKKVGDVGRFSLLKIVKSIGLLGRLITVHLRRKPQAYVLFITNRPASFLVDWMMIELLRTLRRPIVNYVHTSGFSDLAKKNRIFKVLVRRALGAAKMTICLGDALVKDVSWASHGTIRRIPNTPYRLPTKAAAVRCTAPKFVFLSNLLPGKGAPDFIEAAIGVASVESSAKFVVAGASPDESTRRDLRAMISRSPYSDRIDLIGQADEATKWRLLDSSHVLVFPSTYAFEAQPLTIVEAMARGLPVIAYDTGGIRDLVEDGCTGFLIKAGDKASLTDSMVLLAKDDLLRNKFGANAAAYYETHLSRTAYSTAWRSGLRELAEDVNLTLSAIDSTVIE
ncbi:glycosyltransferase family 4 protein [Pseudarthrobacter sp. H2]|uniref:glycosyltransferase family 4 protein n=1 Tax=Pseudarthrobacter sp. H2 TaxID=3418415 RepID=UPI003CE6DB35